MENATRMYHLHPQKTISFLGGSGGGTPSHSFHLVTFGHSVKCIPSPDFVSPESEILTIFPPTTWHLCTVYNDPVLCIHVPLCLSLYCNLPSITSPLSDLCRPGFHICMYSTIAVRFGLWITHCTYVVIRLTPVSNFRYLHTCTVCTQLRS